MLLAKVVGTIVSTVKNDSIKGSKYLLLEKCNQSGEKKGDYLVALDLIGAGNDELVFVAESTSARETPVTVNKPVDAIIIGIIDLILEVKFSSSKSEARRLITQGGVSVNGERIDDLNQIVTLDEEKILKVGKRKFIKKI